MGILDFFRSPPSPEKFAKLVLQAFADSGDSRAMRYEADEFRLVSNDESGAVHNLHNVYRDYNAAERRDRPAVLARFVGAMHAPALPSTFAEARRQLVPLIRGRGTEEYLRLLSATFPKATPYIEASAPFSADSLVMLACDSELAIQTITGQTLRDWGVSFDEALAVATDNLRDATVSKFERAEQPGVFMGAWDDSYETSRILFPDIFYQLDLGGEPVIMMPTRNRLLVTSSNNHAGLSAMAELARDLAEDEGRLVSALMYRFENGKAVEYAPDDEGLRFALAAMKKIYLADDYATQKTLLDKQHENSGVDIFVATYQLVQKNDSGRLISYGVWTESVDTLLPEVELVALSIGGEEGGEAETKLVSWADLRAEVHELRESEAGYPARYRLKTFPSKELIASLATAKF